MSQGRSWGDKVEELSGRNEPALLVRNTTFAHFQNHYYAARMERFGRANAGHGQPAEDGLMALFTYSSVIMLFT